MNVSKCLHDLTVFTKSEKLDHCLFLHLNFWACSYRLMAQVIGSFNMASGIIFYELGIDFVSIWFLGLWLGPWNQCYQSSPKPSVLHEYFEILQGLNVSLEDCETFFNLAGCIYPESNISFKMAQVPPCSGIRKSISCLFWSTTHAKMC